MMSRVAFSVSFAIIIFSIRSKSSLLIIFHLIKTRKAVSGSVRIHSDGFPGGFAGLVRSSNQVALAEKSIQLTLSLRND
jgi:hypothetical protein